MTEAGATAGATAGADPGSDFTAIAGEDDLWDGEMESYDLNGREILLIRLDGEYHAYDGTCPHQSTALITGTLEGNLLTCSAHEWEFDARTGQGVNPRTACLRRHQVRIAGGRVLVSRTAAAHSPLTHERAGAPNGSRGNR